MQETTATLQARKFLGGELLKFTQADALWKELTAADEFSLARRVLKRIRERPESLTNEIPDDDETRDHLCRQEAMLTSKDPALNAATRHDEALRILGRCFRLGSKELDGDGETLGIAGGICKRRWTDLGQLNDLVRAGEFYERGSRGPLGNDAYAHINSAFLEDLLAKAGDRSEERRERARKLRQLIVDNLVLNGTWWNAASRAEALFGLGRYAEATEVIKQIPQSAKREPWQLSTMAQQLAQLAHLHKERPLDVPEIRTFFETLLPNAAGAIRSVIIGKVGLALSGGGFRASYYHLGVLACLAERDVLRDVDVLSCVSGGSIVGACYWLKLRQLLRTRRGPFSREDYIQLIRELIAHFQQAVQGDLRGQIQPSKANVVWRFLQGEHGVLDPEKSATALEEHFYLPLWSGPRPIQMHQLPFEPLDHDLKLAGPGEFNPAKHNWLRIDKVPALILNATTVNTGHAWNFTSTWMGESPWAIHEAADSIPRLEWSHYDVDAGWQIELGRAVAASACVPMVFAPLRLGKQYDGLEVSLVDGGVHDNQGTVALLASNCNLLLVSDACGQLMLENAPTPGMKGLATSSIRSMDTLMERVRLANFADLDARKRSGLLRGLMFLHMKAGLDADVIRLSFSQESYELQRTQLSPSGVRKDFQRNLAELRTDLDIFTHEESCGLMACGYQMASKALDRDLPKLQGFWQGPQCNDWPFKEMGEEITSVANATARRKPLLDALRAGSKVTI